MDGRLLVGQCKSILSIVVAAVATTSPQDTTEVLPITLTTLTNIAVTRSGATMVMKHHKVFISHLIKVSIVFDSCYMYMLLKKLALWKFL